MDNSTNGSGGNSDGSGAGQIHDNEGNPVYTLTLTLRGGVTVEAHVTWFDILRPRAGKLGHAARWGRAVDTPEYRFTHLYHLHPDAIISAAVLTPLTFIFT